MNRYRVALVAAAVALASFVPWAQAEATSALRVRATIANSVTRAMPLLRLTFSAPVRASSLPRLAVRPAMPTTWQQIAPNAVQAVATGRVQPLTRYVVSVPTAVHCSTRCTFTAVRASTTAMTASVLWEQQLLAQLGYLPLTFAALTSTTDPTQSAAGTFTWAYPHLPAQLVAQWHAGEANVLTTGALMAFQDVHHLATTGVADAATWNALLAAAATHTLNPRPYDYVTVSEGSPESLTLYVAGKPAFHALVNTGISVAPTETGTYPVYLRYVHQIMTGHNPDGSYYADPVTWVSYFHGGDALHQFYRATYGWPQSLGCVEMTMSDAQHVWPYTPIGTLVTVNAN